MGATKILAPFAVVAIALGVAQSPTIMRGLAGTDAPPVTQGDQATFDRMCPLIDAYLSVDEAGQKGTGKAISALAAEAARRTEDPAVVLFLDAVPSAFSANGKTRRSAIAFLARECDAHGNPVATKG